MQVLLALSRGHTQPGDLDMMPPKSIICPCCDGTGFEDNWYETDDEGNWEHFTDVCNLCTGLAYISDEQAVVLRLKGEL